MCKTTQLPLGLTVWRDVAWHGLWISSKFYWQWLEDRGIASGEVPCPPRLCPNQREHCMTVGQSIEAGFQGRSLSRQQKPLIRSRLCSICRHLVLPYTAVVGLDLQIFQCGHCNTFWLSEVAWAQLEVLELQDALHHISSPVWQRKLRQQRLDQVVDVVRREQLGADYEQLQELRDWLARSQNREAMLTFLLQPQSSISLVLSNARVML